jgi:uncharacterized protein YabN with tetrapyrrole methylase and pyrophosphatase domain
VRIRHCTFDDDEDQENAVKDATRQGSLTVVGTGIQPIAHTSTQAIGCIQHADKVFFASSDALTEYWIRQLNVRCESLNGLYDPSIDRHTTYERMVHRVVDAVESGLNVCFVLYGHPGVFADPAHDAIRRAREAGYKAQMLPAISADACLFADLGIDPGTTGCQSYEATDFLINRRVIDPRTALLLWQIGVIGEQGYKNEHNAWNREGLRILVEVLLEYYPPEHIVTIYEAARYVCYDAVVHNVRLDELADAPVSAISTLYVPPYGEGPLDNGMVQRLLASTTTL